VNVNHQQDQPRFQAFDPFQDPPARAMSQTFGDPSVVLQCDQFSDIPPPQGPAQAYTGVFPAIQSSVLSQTQDHKSLTVLTLPPLNVNQSSQTLKVAKDMMAEANSLLSLYTNVRLAFSVQDMRHG
jgi:hypothetical protein